MRVPALLLLLPAAVAVQYRYVSTAVVPAQDAVDYVCVAQEMAREGVAAGIRREPVPPLFPAVVAAAHGLLGSAGWIGPHDWALAAQGAAAAALVLLVVPLYLTTQRLAGPTAAVVAPLLLFALPETVRLGADGLADGWHLLFVAWGLWFATSSLVPGVIVTSPQLVRPRFAVAKSPLPQIAASAALPWWGAGTCFGIALLARAEALTVVAACTLLVVGNLVRRRRSAAGSVATHSLAAGAAADRRSTRPNVFDLAALASGAIVCLLPYVAAGIDAPREWATRLRGGAAPREVRPLNHVADGRVEPTLPAPPTASDGTPLVFGHKDRTRSSRFRGLPATGAEFVREFARATGYALLPLAAIGALILRRSARRPADVDLRPARDFLVVLLVLHGLATFVVAWRAGYLSGRHFAVPVYALLPPAAVGVVACVGTLSGALGATRRVRFAFLPTSRPSAAAACGLAFTLVVVATAPAPHASQAAHRRAAEWLQSSAANGGAVLDQQGWTALFTGRTTYRFDAAERALGDPRLAYVVVERGDLEAPSPRGASLRTVLGSADRAAVVFAADRNRTERDVLIFSRPPLAVAQRESIHAR